MSTVTIVFAAFAVLGLVFGSVGALIQARTAAFRKVAEAADGTIVAFSAGRGDSGSGTVVGGPLAASEVRFGSDTVYKPTVEFVTRDGRQVRATSAFGSDPPPGRIGDAVRVLYDPADPQRIRLDTLAGRGGCLAVALIGFGVAMLAVGIIGLAAAG